MTSAGRPFQDNGGSRRGLRFGLILALLAVFGLLLIGGWHDMAFAGHDHAHSGVAATDGTALAHHDSDDDADQPDHVAAHATLHSVDLPPDASSAVPLRLAATPWNASLAVHGPLAAPAMDIRPPRS